MEFKYFKIVRETTVEDVKSQKRDLSKQYHPDIESGNESAMKSVNEEFLLALEIVKRRNKRFKQISELERKALLGLELLNPQIESEIKKVTKDVLIKITNSIASERLKGPLLYGIRKLSPLIDKVDFRILTRNAFELLKHKSK